MWSVKTGRERELPILPSIAALFETAIGSRKAGFVFLNAQRGAKRDVKSTYSRPEAFRAAVTLAVSDLHATNPNATERQKKRALVAFGRKSGQIPERTIRGAFLRLTKRIGCPEFTRVHDLRHLFSTRAQAAGINPMLVQEMLGHTTLEMTKKYTHPGIETKRDALANLLGGSASANAKPGARNESSS